LRTLNIFSMKNSKPGKIRSVKKHPQGNEFSEAYRIVYDWFRSKNRTPFEFQKEAWYYYLNGYNGLLNAPTGSGKTYALWFPVLMEYITNNPDYKNPKVKKKSSQGIQMLWITPLKALSKDIEKAMKEVCLELEIPWQVSTRTGDTPQTTRYKQNKNLHQVLITTPESLHVMLAQKDYPNLFGGLKAVIVDEWHELLGSKRGVQAELGLSRLRGLNPQLKVWGISATIGNLTEALDVLLGDKKGRSKIVRAEIEKKLNIQSILPDEVEKFPWAGHLGIRLLPKIVPIIKANKSTLIFTNTRSQSEIWYQKLLEYHPDFAGEIALHHGSIDKNLRAWVERALHNEKLKVVVCTSSLDLGVDFRPVDTVIQIGSPKGVARFLQRAGRSGHQPDAVSKIYFVPTHSLELVEGAALKEAISQKIFEDRQPILKPYDVLIQYLLTLAVSDGFDEKKIYKEVINTFAYQTLNKGEWEWIIKFISHGGDTLKNYDEYSKAELVEGFYKVTSRRKAMFHKLGIGTIDADLAMSIRFVRGGRLGTIEESFITSLKIGDTFAFAGRTLELVSIKENTAYVRKTRGKSGRVPSWMGGRMPLSSRLSDMLRKKMNEALERYPKDIEMVTIKPLIELQQKRSAVPASNELLIEKFQTEEGYHLFVYPFEGRLVHEGMAAVFSFRMSRLKLMTFSYAMNDYGFELLSDTEIPVEEAIKKGLFSDDNLIDDIYKSINSGELAKRKFRPIARISGLIFTGYPGKYKTTKSLQASAQLLFDVFSKYEPSSLLLKQAHEEMLQFQLEELRLRKALDRIRKQRILIKETDRPTPFSFPIMVDFMREKMTSEKLEDRVRKMQLLYEKD
jgi:ATP-dependent Lhr-like helicase